MQGDGSLWRVPVGFTKGLVAKVCEDDDSENVDVWVVKGESIRLSSKSISLAVASDVLSLIESSDQQLQVLIAPVHLRQQLLCQKQVEVQEMLWDVWVIDCLEMTCEVVLESIPLEDANDFKAVWRDEESLVILLPVGFELCGIQNSQTCQASSE